MPSLFFAYAIVSKFLKGNAFSLKRQKATSVAAVEATEGRRRVRNDIQL
jgi:hypothetical protein